MCERHLSGSVRAGAATFWKHPRLLDYRLALAKLASLREGHLGNRDRILIASHDIWDFALYLTSTAVFSQHVRAGLEFRFYQRAPKARQQAAAWSLDVLDSSFATQHKIFHKFGVSGVLDRRFDDFFSK
jgi:hypothetical protein